MNLKSRIFRAVLSAAALLPYIAYANPIPTGADKLGLHTVVIDPGHGGKDPGSISKDKKTYEKTLVMDISKRLKDKIETAYSDVSVKLTRADDNTFVELKDRAKFATSNNAGLFISIHVNASDRKTSPHGYSVHLLGPSQDKNKDTYAFNMEVCKRENEVIFLEDDYSTKYEGFDPSDPESDIFLRLMHNAYREQSLLFGQIVDRKLGDSKVFRKGWGITQNNFAVLRLATMPAVLLEMGYISDSGDLGALKSENSRERMAQALFEAFCEYKSLYDESVGAPHVEPDLKKVAAKSPAPKKEETTQKKEETTTGKTDTRKDDAASGKVETAPKAPATATDASAAGETGTWYGTQVLASSKVMGKKDKYFLGYEYRTVKVGTIYKYIIGTSEDKESAKAEFARIKSKYPDAFFVKVENGVCTRAK